MFWIVLRVDRLCGGTNWAFQNRGPYLPHGTDEYGCWGFGETPEEPLESDVLASSCSL